MSITATNINGTSQNACACGSWLKHWERFSRSKAGHCSELTCMNTAEVGAHVMKGMDAKWYIIPLCTSHNNDLGQSIQVSEATLFIPASVAETCGKK